MLGIASVGPLGPPAGASVDAHEVTAASAPEPVDRAEREAWVLIAGASRVGPISLNRLVERFGSARRTAAVAALGRAGSALIEATSDDPFITPEAAAEIAERVENAHHILEPIERLGLRVLLLSDAEYPRRLFGIELPPPVLLVRGEVSALDPERAVAVVGTRRATEAGRALAIRLATGIADAGATIVSGLALGIDGAAHAAAVTHDRPTVAVLGSGHDRFYPRANERLARQIVDGGGAIVSEHAPDEEPTRWSFPRRNRVISGLSDAVVVVQAPRKSGALSTAQCALEQGRPAFLVPGHLEEPAYEGSLEFLHLYAPQARIVASKATLLEELGLVHAPRPGRGRTRVRLDALGLSSVELRLAELLRTDGHTVDHLVRALGLPVATILGALTLLEMRGLVSSAYGRYRPTPALAGAVRPDRRGPGR